MAGRNVAGVIEQLLSDWAAPREPAYLQQARLPIQMRQQCTAERADGPVAADDTIPDDLRAFWSTFSSARLFEDIDYGQWGLVVLTYEASNERTRQLFDDRPDEVAPGDRVIGRFIGDEDLLLVRCDAVSADYGAVLVAIRDGWRGEWYQAADTFSTFLEEYASADGRKYWEIRAKAHLAGPQDGSS